ncbi:MAG: hypothetical protein ABW007_19240 [Chitinophagaceae bacterium]
MAITRKIKVSESGLPKVGSPLDDTQYGQHTDALAKYINAKVAKYAKKPIATLKTVKSKNDVKGLLRIAKAEYKGVFKSMQTGVSRKIATAMFDGADKLTNTGRLRRDGSRKTVIEGLTKNVEFYTEAYFRRIVEPKLKSFVAKNKDSATFKKDFDALVKKSLTQAGNYWANVSDTVAGRSFHYGLLKGAEGKGHTGFELVAVIDQRTTPFCRSIHGKRFLIKDALEDIEELSLLRGKDVQHGPWALVSEGKASITEMKKEGFITPPFHCSCRTRVVVI